MPKESMTIEKLAFYLGLLTVYTFMMFLVVFHVAKANAQEATVQHVKVDKVNRYCWAIVNVNGVRAHVSTPKSCMLKKGDKVDLSGDELEVVK